MARLSEIIDLLNQEDVALKNFLVSDSSKCAWSLLRSWLFTTLNPQIPFSHPCLSLTPYTIGEQPLNKVLLDPYQDKDQITCLISTIITTQLRSYCPSDPRFNILISDGRIAFLHRNSAHLDCISTRRLLGLLEYYSITALHISTHDTRSFCELVDERKLTACVTEHVLQVLHSLSVLSSSSALLAARSLSLHWNNVFNSFVHTFLTGVAKAAAFISSTESINVIFYDQFMDPYSLGLLYSSRFYSLRSFEIVHGSLFEPWYQSPLSLRSSMIYPDGHISLSPQAEYMPSAIRHRTVLSHFRSIPSPGDALPHQLISPYHRRSDLARNSFWGLA